MPQFHVPQPQGRDHRPTLGNLVRGEIDSNEAATRVVGNLSQQIPPRRTAQFQHSARMDIRRLQPVQRRHRLQAPDVRFGIGNPRVRNFFVSELQVVG
jgi:hypothetical protein